MDIFETYFKGEQPGLAEEKNSKVLGLSNLVY